MIDQEGFPIQARFDSTGGEEAGRHVEGIVD